MNSEQWQKVKALFSKAVELPLAERESFLKNECGSDNDLYNEVISLLEADSNPHEMMQGSAGEKIGSLVDDDLSGQVIDKYKILKKLAGGGMGTVYLAERIDGQFSQTVAFKVLNLGMNSQEILKRFHAERQILANLQHPNIASIIDGGITDSGRPYFTMEYVDGLTITDYCDTHKLSIEKRLDLFSTICEAVQYAHQNLIVHRDLKPGNILVNKSGEVKLLDFGIAKVIGQYEDHETARDITRTGMRVMTPGYASPEQIMGNPVTTSSDVYSLGIVLCELLSGQRPFDIEGRSPIQIEKLLSTTDPSKPSDLVSEEIKSADSKLISQHRSIEQSKLRRLLSGDLDNICLMALRREPTRRYATVDQFRDDIKHYLEKKPVTARPDTLGYRVSRFVSRNNAAVGTTLITLLIIALMIAYYTIQISEERDLALKESQKAQQVSEFLSSLFEAADPNEAQGEEITATELLKLGAERIDEELAEQPEVQAEMLSVIGNVYNSLSMLEQADTLLHRAYHLFDSLYDGNHADVANALRNIGVTMYDLSNYDSSVICYYAALKIDSALPGDNSLLIATDLTNAASSQRLLGNFEEAEELFLEALATRRSNPEVDPLDLAHNLNHLGRLYSDQGRKDEAIPLYREGLSIRKSILGQDHFEVIASQGALAGALRAEKDLEGSEQLYRTALASLKKMVGEDHNYVGGIASSLAHVLREQERFEEADSLYRLALDILEKTLPADHPNKAIMYDGMAMVRQQTGAYKEAVAFGRESLRLREAKYPEGSTMTANSRAILGNSLRLAKEYSEAEEVLLNALQAFSDALGLEHRFTIITREHLYNLYNDWGKPEKAADFQTDPEKI